VTELIYRTFLILYFSRSDTWTNEIDIIPNHSVEYKLGCVCWFRSFSMSIIQIQHVRLAEYLAMRAQDGRALHEGGYARVEDLAEKF